MIVSDIQDYPYSTRLAKRIEEVLPKQTTVTIGAYYGFHMGKELLFRTQNAYYFVTDDKDAVLRTYVGRPLLFINPTQEEIQQLTHAFPDNTMETYDNTHGESMAFFYPPPE
jgi:FAD synthase